MAKGATSSFPAPHDEIDIEVKTIRAGTPLFRLHAACFLGNQFNKTGHGDARFSPLYHRESGVVIPTLYAGETPEVAICEVLFHDVDISLKEIVFEQSRLASIHHTKLVTLEDVTVAVMSPVSVVRMRAGKKLIHCDAADYALTRAWAEYIHQQHRSVQGLEWPSRQHEGQAWVFFGDRIKQSTLQIKRSTLLRLDREIRGKIIHLAQRMNMTII